MIAPGYGRFEPKRGVASGQYVLLDAKCRDEEAVNHVLRGHDQLDVLAGGDVQLIDLALPLHVLDLPHPLLGYDIDLGGVGGRRALLEINNSSPNKRSEERRVRQDSRSKW